MRRFLVGAALVIAATPVMAADYMLYEPLPAYGHAPAQTWSGQYIGATIGGLRPRIDVPTQGVLEGNAFVGGVFAGVNYQEPNGLVLGAEADAEYSSYHVSTACTNAAWTCRGNIGFQGSLRGRLGYAMDSFLVYGTAGLAVAHVGGSTVSPANVEYSDHHVRMGWTAGLGAEVAFSDAWFARAEYRYTDLGAQDMNFDVVYPGVKVTSHAVRAGIGYRF